MEAPDRGVAVADVPANSKLMLVMEYVEGGTILFWR